MKKLNVLVLALLFAGTIFAQEADSSSASGSPLSIDVGGAITVETGDNIITADGGSFDMLAGIFNIIKAGVYGDAIYSFNEFVGVGGEIGFYAFTTKENTVPALFDLPLLAIVEGNLFDIIRVKGHVGYTLSSHLVLKNSDAMLALINKLDIGCRVFLGGLYIDYSLMSWNDGAARSSQKWALGYEISL